MFVHIKSAKGIFARKPKDTAGGNICRKAGNCQMCLHTETSGTRIFNVAVYCVHLNTHTHTVECSRSSCRCWVAQLAAVASSISTHTAAHVIRLLIIHTHSLCCPPSSQPGITSHVSIRSHRCRFKVFLYGGGAESDWVLQTVSFCVCVCVGFVKTQSFLIRDSVFCKHSKLGDDVCFCVFAALNTGEHVLSVGTWSSWQAEMTGMIPSCRSESCS